MQHGAPVADVVVATFTRPPPAAPPRPAATGTRPMVAFVRPCAASLPFRSPPAESLRRSLRRRPPAAAAPPRRGRATVGMTVASDRAAGGSLTPAHQPAASSVPELDPFSPSSISPDVFLAGYLTRIGFYADAPSPDGDGDGGGDGSTSAATATTAAAAGTPTYSVANPPPPTYETLARVHLCHLLALPFENLSVFATATMPNTLDAAWHKLVAGTRGGWCLEHNALLRAAARYLGYPAATPRPAWVLPAAPDAAAALLLPAGGRRDGGGDGGGGGGGGGAVEPATPPRHLVVEYASPPAVGGGAVAAAAAAAGAAAGPPADAAAWTTYYVLDASRTVARLADMDGVRTHFQTHPSSVFRSHRLLTVLADGGRTHRVLVDRRLRVATYDPMAGGVATASAVVGGDEGDWAAAVAAEFGVRLEGGEAARLAAEAPLPPTAEAADGAVWWSMMVDGGAGAGGGWGGEADPRLTGRTVGGDRRPRARGVAAGAAAAGGPAARRRAASAPAAGATPTACLVRRRPAGRPPPVHRRPASHTHPPPPPWPLRRRPPSAPPPVGDSWPAAVDRWAGGPPPLPSGRPQRRHPPAGRAWQRRRRPPPPPHGDPPPPPAAPVDYAAIAAEEGVTLVPGTPLTPAISSSPMAEAERRYYTRLFVQAIAGALGDLRSGASTNYVLDVTLLLPQLNPELDIYDRRFLLRVAWALVADLVGTGAPTADGRAVRPAHVRVVTQSAEKFGGLPISVAGLRRTFAADRAVSADAWGGADAMADAVRDSDIEADALAADDDVVLVLSPTNTTGAPVVADVAAMAAAATAARVPLLIFNGRLADVLSHSGVMGARGRGARFDFLASAARPFYLKLLYATGSWYPVRGALSRVYPGAWQVWARDTDADTYALIGEWPGAGPKPTTSEITDAFEAAEFRAAAARRAAAAAGGGGSARRWGSPPPHRGRSPRCWSACRRRWWLARGRSSCSEPSVPGGARGWGGVAWWRPHWRPWRPWPSRSAAVRPCLVCAPPPRPAPRGWQSGRVCGTWRGGGVQTGVRAAPSG
ncbi:hypothetical protein BU14_0023s0055 [Porphyra umbilicalis]|uniref:DUF1995 domain-containing protein n=1 Tax=Porphyra umbilicalis TaxID=2786 RepID=A0A1X6PK99_PORUM|nr:hypothetical protein BU14_0023s0055 [Porphyra umbilicalis]|eukprot:OSX81250.1 hypothetical protein BU14_0023s0055 [Porphyra umbilicalis]